MGTQETENVIDLFFFSLFFDKKTSLKYNKLFLHLSAQEEAAHGGLSNNPKGELRLSPTFNIKGLSIRDVDDTLGKQKKLPLVFFEE